MNIDWFPTLLDLCGLDASGIDVDGVGIVPLIRDGAEASPHDVLHFDFERQWAVRRGDWKLICNAIDVLPNDRNKTLEGLYLTNLKIDRRIGEPDRQVPRKGAGAARAAQGLRGFAGEGQGVNPAPPSVVRRMHAAGEHPDKTRGGRIGLPFTCLQPARISSGAVRPCASAAC